MIQVIERALAILEFVAEEPETPRGLGEIAGRAGLNAATCARILQTLVAAGYVAQVAPKKGYLLGPMAYLLAARGPYRKDLVLAAEPHLTELAHATGETVLLAALQQGRRVVLSQIDGSQAVQIRGDLLQVFDPYATATGRLLLAHLPETALKAFVRTRGLPGDRWPEASSAEALAGILAQVRREGRVIRRAGDVVGIACPIVEGDRVTAALGLYLPAHRFEGEHRERILRSMSAAAEAISRTAAG